MEFEIDDDPQGEFDRAEGDRTGGVKERSPLRRKELPGSTRDGLPVRQLA